MDSQPTVLVTITTLDFGGAETQLVEVARRLRGRGWHITVAVLDRPRAFVEELTDRGIDVHSLGLTRRTRALSSMARLRSLVRSIQPIVVHSHLFHANILTRLARPLTPMPVLISTAHSIKEGGSLREWAYRVTDRFTDVTTHVSQAAVERYVTENIVPRSRIRHVPNGVDTDRFAPDEGARRRSRDAMRLDQQFVFLCVGRFIREKGHESLLRSFRCIATPDSTLLLVGDGPEHPRIESLVQELGLADQVRLLGIRRDVPDLMNAADAYVTASEREGLPMVLLEASSAGLPIVATDVGGTREIVDEGRSGLLVEPGDTAALARAMEVVIEMPQPERRSMGARGRRRTAGIYSLEVITDQWEQLYEELLQRRHWAGPRPSSSGR